MWRASFRLQNSIADISHAAAASEVCLSTDDTLAWIVTGDHSQALPLLYRVRFSEPRTTVMDPKRQIQTERGLDPYIGPVCDLCPWYITRPYSFQAPLRRQKRTVVDVPGSKPRINHAEKCRTIQRRSYHGRTLGLILRLCFVQDMSMFLCLCLRLLGYDPNAKIDKVVGTEGEETASGSSTGTLNSQAVTGQTLLRSELMTAKSSTSVHGLSMSRLGYAAPSSQTSLAMPRPASLSRIGVPLRRKRPPTSMTWKSDGLPTAASYHQNRGRTTEAGSNTSAADENGTEGITKRRKVRSLEAGTTLETKGPSDTLCERGSSWSEPACDSTSSFALFVRMLYYESVCYMYHS